MGKPGFPISPPAGGLRARPSYGGGNRAPPPSGGRLGWGKPGFPLPVQMRAGGPRTHFPARGRVKATPSSRGMGKPGFPISPPAGGLGRARPSYGGGNQAPPPSGGRLGGGKPGFPLPLQMRAGGPRTHFPARGRVRATPSSRGMGKPGFPISPPAGGFGRARPSQENRMCIPSLCGVAAWTAEAEPPHRVIV